MYSQSKGRHLNVGQHKELLSYLLSICPLLPRFLGSPMSWVARKSLVSSAFVSSIPEILLVKTQGTMLRLCHLTIFFFSLKAEWMYSQSKGRHFNVGQHEELLSYLLSICPLHPGEDWEEDKKLNLILSKVQEHQQSLRDPGSGGKSISLILNS